MEIKVSDFLCKFSSEKILFHPNPGNAGDALINVGCFDLFKSLNLDYETFWHENSIDCKRVIVLGGGGGFVPEWSFTRNFVTKYHKSADRLILLPQTIAGNEDILKKLGSNVDVFVREEVTYEHVKKHLVGGANLYLSDDMAFNVDVKKAISERVNALNVKSRVKDLLVDISARKFINSDKVLNAFRTDSEKSDIAIPDNNFDVSLPYSLGTKNEYACRRTVNRFLNFLSKHEIVKTNRLHVAVGAGLLGKDVHFYANGYYKCKAVYDYSISRKLSNVQWMNE